MGKSKENAPRIETRELQYCAGPQNVNLKEGKAFRAVTCSLFLSFGEVPPG